MPRETPCDRSRPSSRTGSEITDGMQLKKILDDKTLKRKCQTGNEADRNIRAGMIMKAIKKAKVVEPDRDWPQDKHELREALYAYVKEAMDDTSENNEGAKLGTITANCGIAARTFKNEPSKSKEIYQTADPEVARTANGTVAEVARGL